MSDQQPFSQRYVWLEKREVEFLRRLCVQHRKFLADMVADNRAALDEVNEVLESLAQWGEP
jgi:hypothetical protein